MSDLEISYVDGVALVAASGSMITASDATAMAGMIAEVYVDDHLIIDVTSVDRLTAEFARELRDVLVERVTFAEVAIASARPEVTLQLVLHDVDRLVPIVASIEHALEVIRARSGIAGAA